MQVVLRATSIGRLFLAFVVALPLGHISRAVAQYEDEVKRDVYDLPTPVAIQGRTNRIDESLSLTAGYLPTDSFNRGFPVGASYAYYFKPYFAWDVVSFSYNLNRETQLKNDLRALGVTAQNVGFGGVIDYPKYIVLTGITYTPLYSKSLLFNKSLVHSETSFYLGVGSLMFSQVGNVPTIVPGIQGRYFITPGSALRLYLREYFFNDKNLGITGLTEIGIGYEIQLGFLSRRSDDADYATAR